MPRFAHHGFTFHYVDSGNGIPFVFQHGLGGSAGQAVDLIPQLEGIRVLSLDCRNHGLTEPSRTAAQLGFAPFAGDLAALLDHLGLAHAYFGGVSMGAALSLRMALDHPQRVRGLLLVRPAWLDGPMPAREWLTTVARLIREHGPARGRALLAASEAFQRLQESAPDPADSLLRQFDAPQAAQRVARLEVMPMDAPIPSLGDLQKLCIPAHVIATDRDPIHPLDLARTLAAALPAATFQQVIAKSDNLARHTEEARTAIAAWLARESRKLP